MNIKIFIGEIFKKTGLLKLCLKITRKFGYLSTFTDHHANGVNLEYDIFCDGMIDNIESVIDVGASIGSMTSYFLRIFPSCSVHAIEPYSVSFNAASKNFAGNSRVKVHPLGFSDKVGEQVMFIQPDSGYNSLNSDINLPSAEMNDLSEKIQIDTLDEFCSRNAVEKIDFLKIDTEGLDLKVLKGGEKLLLDGKIHYIFVECTFDRSNKQNSLFDELRDYLSSFDFKVRAIYEQSNFGDKRYLTCVNALFKLQKQG